ncbi:MAG: hypothetical protein ACLUMK_11385 [Christensenellales bacterium]
MAFALQKLTGGGQAKIWDYGAQKMWYDRGEQISGGTYERRHADGCRTLEGDAQGTEETSAQELAEGLTQSDGQEEAQNDGEARSGKRRKRRKATSGWRHRAGILSLAEDGWTTDEIRAFSQDGKVRENLARGMTLRQAARLSGGRTREKAKESRKRSWQKTGRQTARRAYGETDGDGRVGCGQHDRKHDRRAIPRILEAGRRGDDGGQESPL